MSKFLFLLVACMAFHSVNGLNLFSCCVQNTYDYMDCCDDYDMAIYGYYLDSPKLNNRHIEPYVIDYSNSNQPEIYNTNEDEVAIDFSIPYSKSAWMETECVKEKPIPYTVEIVCPKSIRPYFFESDDEDFDIDSQEVDWNLLTSNFVVGKSI